MLRLRSRLIAAFLILWGGSFEIDRFFALHGHGFQDAALAAQMGYSIWWAFYAALVLVVGFVVGSSAARYFAMALFAVTLGGLLMLSLSFGMMVAGKADIMAYNMAYVLMFVVAFFTSPWDKIKLDSMVFGNKRT